MPDNRADHDTRAAATPGQAGSGRRELERLDETECLALISAGGIGRLAYNGRFGPTVVPVNYQLHEGAILFRTSQSSPAEEDLRTGIADADYQVAFEIDQIDPATREGWSVLVRGPAHHLDTGPERESAAAAGVRPWPDGEREHYIRIDPTRITGRRVRRA